MVMTETGRYNNMYQRPYITDIDGGTMNILAERIANSDAKRATSGLVSGIASSIASPTATPGSEVIIPYGWNERRIRFVMEVEFELSTGSVGIYYIQGYTAYPGVSLTGAVDPNMPFIINSYTSVNRVHVMTPMGLSYKDMITDSAQLFTNPDGSVFANSNMMYGLRPEDIYKGIQSSFLTSSMDLDGSMVDTRYVLNGKLQRSNRSNNIPSNYVGKILDSYMVANDLVDFGQGNSDIISRSLHNSLEPSVKENHFMSVLATINSGVSSNMFTWGQLQRLDMAIDAKTQYLTLGEAVRTSTGVHDVGMSEYWTGSNYTTHIASILSSAIPALMMEHMLQKVVMRSTNHDLMSNMNTIVVEFSSLSHIDPSHNVNLFKHRFEMEVMRDVSMNNQMAYMLEIKCDLFGETWISISIDSEPMVLYTVPSFCDSLYTPVMTNNRDHFSRVTNDFNQLVSYVTDEVAGSSGYTSGNKAMQLASGI